MLSTFTNQQIAEGWRVMQKWTAVYNTKSFWLYKSCFLCHDFLSLSTWLKVKELVALLSSYRSCLRPVHRRKISLCGTSSKGTSPLRSQRCTAPAGCRWRWSCWNGCRNTASPSLEVLCRKVWPPSWSPHTSSWWSPLIRQKQMPQSWGWAQEKPAARALTSWSRPGQRKWNEKATNPGFRYISTVFRLPADISNLHNLVAFGASWVRIFYILLPAPVMCCHFD